MGVREDLFDLVGAEVGECIWSVLLDVVDFFERARGRGFVGWRVSFGFGGCWFSGSFSRVVGFDEPVLSFVVFLGDGREVRVVWPLWVEVV